jgi:putative glutamine amidotransferase
MTHRPRIGVTTSITVGVAPERTYVNSTYLRAVQAAGGVPVLLPPTLDREARRLVLADLDGLLLTGGGDVEPGRFGEAPHPTVSDVAPARDELEIEVTRTVLDDGRPLLAICRGLQVLNVALGGTLHQDVASDSGTPVHHSQREPRDQPSHRVKVAPASHLADVLGAEEIDVNSMHHQAVKALGRDLIAVAWAPDDIVEGVELADRRRFVLGVQWHPEELVGHSDAARRLFTALVGAATSRR